MNVKLAFSPCPNDTYMMYALVHGLVPQNDVNFDIEIMDVEELNVAALAGTYDMTKLSFKTYYEVSDQYDLLDAGAALGRGNGPLLIAQKPLSKEDLATCRIAVPGMNTTATFLLQFAYPQVKNLKPMLFSNIESSIAAGEVDAGVIIHETRFMYAARGFALVDDLGAVWEKRTDMPIPLGCFAVRNTLDETVKKQLNESIITSISYANQHYARVLPFMKHHAQELEDNVIRQHVDMFVNQFSLSLGQVGKSSVRQLFSELNKIYGNQRLPKFI